MENTFSINQPKLMIRELVYKNGICYAIVADLTNGNQFGIEINGHITAKMDVFKQYSGQPLNITEMKYFGDYRAIVERATITLDTEYDGIGDLIEIYKLDEEFLRKMKGE